MRFNLAGFSGQGRDFHTFQLIVNRYGGGRERYEVVVVRFAKSKQDDQVMMFELSRRRSSWSSLRRTARCRVGGTASQGCAEQETDASIFGHCERVHGVKIEKL